MVKRGIYRLIAISLKTKNPCTFNKIFVLSALLITNLFVSWYYKSSLASFELIEHLIGNSALSIELSFILVFTVILLLKYAFNISISSHESYFLESFFKVILNGLYNVNIALNACEINILISKIWRYYY
jgi:hypothetical protein